MAQVHCLVVSGISLTQEMHDVLYWTASLMIRKESSIRNLKRNDMEGQIRTAFVTRVIAGMSGIEFYADMEKEGGKGRIKFLVRPSERPPKGQWHIADFTDEEAQELDRWWEEGLNATH